MNLATAPILLLTVATVVALLARRVRLPYTVALVVVGLILGTTHLIRAPQLTKDLLYSAFLPGLLFEAAFHLEAKDFWRNRGAILTLAVPGVVLAIAVTAPLLAWMPARLGWTFGLAWPAALVFAALIAATDPIAVVALFRVVGAPRRLSVVVDGESLVNDGTAVVLYTLAVGVASGTTSSLGGASLDFVRVVGLGVALGAALGFAISLLLARIDDPLVEITLTTLAAYGPFIVAEHLHASGVLATVTAGMLCGSYGAPRGMSPSTRLAVESFWQYVAFALNSMVFLLIGLGVRSAQMVQSWRSILLAYAAVMVTRAAVVFLTLAALRGTRERMDWAWGLVLTWGGLRGALSMVLALALAESFPDRWRVVHITFGVVVLTILVNGLTVGPLLRRLGVAVSPAPLRP
jgi:CPA1 family monovalent cation:H+ antiporter